MKLDEKLKVDAPFKETLRLHIMILSINFIGNYFRGKLTFSYFIIMSLGFLISVPLTYYFINHKSFKPMPNWKIIGIYLPIMGLVNILITAGIAIFVYNVLGVAN